jgi:hypothetical protein
MVPNGWLTDTRGRQSRRGRADISIDIREYEHVKFDALNKHLSQNGGEAETDPQDRLEHNVEEFITVIDTGK